MQMHILIEVAAMIGYKKNFNLFLKIFFYFFFSIGELDLAI